MTLIENPEPFVSLRRLLDDGQQLDIHPMTFGKFRLYVGPQNSPVYDDGW